MFCVIRYLFYLGREKAEEEATYCVVRRIVLLREISGGR